MYTKIKALSDSKLHSQAEILKKAFDTYTGLIETDKSLNYNFKTKSFLNNFVNFQVATKIGLGFATIPNVTQTFISTALRLGYSPFFKGSFKVLKDREYIESIKKYSGAGSIEMHNIIVGFQSGQGTKLGRLADATTKLFGFQGINKVNKLVSAYSALEAAKGWQKQATLKPKTLRQARKRDIAIRNLREMGVKDLNMKMSAKTMAKVMYEFSRDAQLQKNVFLEPSFFAKAGFASYPTYDNVEDISENEIDSLLTDFSTPFDERYPFTGSGTDTSGLRVDTAGKGMKDSTGNVSGDIEKLKTSNIYNQLGNKTEAQKKQMVDKVLGRDVPLQEMRGIISKLGVQTRIVDPVKSLKSLIPRGVDKDYVRR